MGIAGECPRPRRKEVQRILGVGSHLDTRRVDWSAGFDDANYERRAGTKAERICAAELAGVGTGDNGAVGDVLKSITDVLRNQKPSLRHFRRSVLFLSLE